MIRDDATQRQIEAADPTQSTWLSANAGSGKTRVLTDRVARLLLGGTLPENILCLTYTKAAASEMQNRLFERLGKWAMMPEGALRRALKELGHSDVVTGDDVRQARRLFAAAIETPGGLKIQTIHSFCAGVLRRFPLEARVSPQFTEMEDQDAELLRADVLDEMAGEDDTAPLDALAEHFTGAEISGLLAGITGRRATFGSVPAEADLAATFGLEHGIEPDAVLKVAFVGGEDDLAKELLERSADASASYVKFAQKLAALSLSDPNAQTLSDLQSLFTTKLGERKSWPTATHKSAWTAFEPILEDMWAWMDRVVAAIDYEKAIKAYHKTRALYDFAVPFVERYEHKKLQRAALDFDDLVRKAKELLENPVVAQWVLFRLDGGVEHVLVDEAQDTSPDQWDIVRLLTQEFSTGQGAHPDRERTVFVVGDKKQSIYSFQGADPDGFDRMREHFSEELSKVQKKLQDSQLLYSFRSSEAVLRLVDQTFLGDMADGVEEVVQHLAFKSDMPGRVDLWPMVEKPEKAEEQEWDDPLDLKGEENHTVVLADRVASQIKHMIQHDTLPQRAHDEEEWSRRRITPGDFLILVQRRSDLFDEIISACKTAGLEIAGADRLKLGGELAVKDIAALLQFLALPEDDLSLAAALKSPIFGWSEQDLFTLSHHRKPKQTLWEALRKSGAHPRTMEIINDLRNNADFLRPYDLINRLLIRHGGRHALLARLGHEAEDGIDALLSQALGYERADIPSLTGFLSWLETEDVEIKRQMDSSSDRIRVMTVHGAKGLEAPIVILPDCAKRDIKFHGELLETDGTAIWKPKAPDMPNVLKQIQDNDKAAQIRERRRLLYVALTRAESWLIVAGAGESGTPDTCWHDAVSEAFSRLDVTEQDTDFGAIKRFERHDWNKGELRAPQTQPNQRHRFPVFDEVKATPDEAASTYAPSDLGGEKALQGEGGAQESEAALAWGTILHQLLEMLPATPAEGRKTLGRSLISNHSDVGLIVDQEQLLGEALSVLDDPSLAHLFTSGLSEVPIVANLESLGGARIFGTIDRLIVSPDTVLAVDYKSNAIVPQTAEATPLGLVRQMAAYRDGLKQIFPNHKIETALLWTKPCRLSVLPDPLLDDALKGVSLA